MSEFNAISRSKYSSLQMLREREVGTTIFQNDTVASNYYKYIKKNDSFSEKGNGGIFNLQFSPSGKILVAACESRSILILDPFSRKLVCKIQPAHNDCVNCICFLDERTFVSGSDDSTIGLWDVRMLQSHVMKLEGHTSWVKNLAYNKSTAQLVSSAYDGTVRLWDINRYTDDEVKGKVIHTVDKLSRMQLTLAGDKLLVSTFDGTISVFHNLNMETLADDLNQQLDGNSQKVCPGDRNYKESITDFPFPPLYISALQVHPFGWCVMSRYTSSHFIEYTVIHDIQSGPSEQAERDSVPNMKRLSHFIPESNSAKGIIKEQDFSYDGHVIASPFAHGVRLLTFVDNCDHNTATASQLHELRYLITHQHAVCTSRFSPTHMMLATGCLGGDIVFHEPRL